MSKSSYKLIKGYVITFSFLLIILTFFNYLLKISYLNIHEAIYSILITGLFIVVISICFSKHKKLQRAIQISGLASCNLLFLHCFYVLNWDFNVLFESKWAIVFTQSLFILSLYFSFKKPLNLIINQTQIPSLKLKGK